MQLKNSKIYPWVVVGLLWVVALLLGFGFAMLGGVVLLALGLQLYFLRSKTDNVE